MKLPEIFKNKLDENINNNERVFIGNNIKNESKEDIFNNLPVKVTIITNKDEKIVTTIVGKTKNYLITKNRNVLYIKDIKSIKKNN